MRIKAFQRLAMRLRVSRTFAPLSSPFCAVGEVTGPAQVGSVIIVR